MKKIRESAGGAYESRGKLFARVTVAPQKRLSVLLPWATELAAADARAKWIQALVNRLRAAEQFDFVEKVLEVGATDDAEKLAALERAVDGILTGVIVKADAPATGPLTFRKFAEQWTGGDLHRDYPDHVPDKKTTDDDEGRLTKWIYPVVGDVPLASFTLEHAQEVMRKLPRDLSPASRRHVAQLLVRVLNLAVYPCRHLKASPLPRGFLPKLGPRKALAYLYPDEDAKLLACTATHPVTGAPLVPLVHRLLYGFLNREGMRSDEAQTLQWRDLDLARGWFASTRTRPTSRARGRWTPVSRPRSAPGARCGRPPRKTTTSSPASTSPTASRRSSAATYTPRRSSARSCSSAARRADRSAFTTCAPRSSRSRWPTDAPRRG